MLRRLCPDCFAVFDENAEFHGIICLITCLIDENKRDNLTLGDNSIDDFSIDDFKSLLSLK